jgi:hypothetical protein
MTSYSNNTLYFPPFIGSDVSFFLPLIHPHTAVLHGLHPHACTPLRRPATPPSTATLPHPLCLRRGCCQSGMLPAGSQRQEAVVRDARRLLPRRQEATAQARPAQHPPAPPP